MQKIKSYAAKNIFNILVRIKNFIYHYSIIIYLNINFLNISIVIFLGSILYKFFSEFNLNEGFIAFLVSFFISILISNYVFNKFRYSDNNLIRNLQKFAIFLIFIFISICITLVFSSTVFCSSGVEGGCALEINNQSNVESNIVNNENKGKDIVNVNVQSEAYTKNKNYYTFQADKKIVDKTVEAIGEASKMVVQQIAPNIGAGSAAGAAAAAMVKATSGLPPVQRIGLIGATALITATSAKIGLDIGTKLTQNSNIVSQIKNSKFSHPNIDRIPSPDNNFINSTLEKGDLIEQSPLEVLLMYQFTLNVFILILIITLLILIFNRYILYSNLEFISSLLEKYMPNKFKD